MCVFVCLVELFHPNHLRAFGLVLLWLSIAAAREKGMYVLTRVMLWLTRLFRVV